MLGSLRSARGPALFAVVAALAAAAFGVAHLVTRSADGAGPRFKDPAQPVPRRVDDLLGRMSLDDKLGQMIQSEQLSTTTGDLVTYRIGSKPENAAAMASIVTGMQGSTLGGPTSIMATAKHYLGDGGTTRGVDYGHGLTYPARTDLPRR